MKWALLVALATIVLPVHAGCERVEFAELKTYERDDLQIHYCLAMIEATTEKALMDNAMNFQRHREADEHSRQFSRCSDEAIRAWRVMDLRFGKKALKGCGVPLWNDPPRKGEQGK